MQKTQFMLAVNKLKEVYGDKKYPGPRVEIMWRRFGELNYDDFIQAVNKLIGDCSYAPMIDTITNELTTSIANNIAAKREEFNKASSQNCSICSNTGIVSMVRLKASSGEQNWAFQCVCDRGPMFASSFPKITAEVKLEFESNFRAVRRKLSEAS